MKGKRVPGRVSLTLMLVWGLLVLAGDAQAALAYRRQITILGAQVGAVGTPHNDFPVLVSLTDPTLRLTVNGGRMGHASAYDIAFRDAGLALLDWEVERYDGVTGTLIAWVRIPSLPAGAGNDTVIYLDYGDCTVSAPTNTPANVWNAYRYVFHMGESGTANPVDSTSNAVSAVRNPTADAGILNAYTAAGRIGGALDLQVGPVVPPANQFLPTTPTHVRVNDPDLDLNTVFTLETWVRLDTVAAAYVGIQTKARESGTRWVGIDRIDTGLPSFIWQLPEGNVDGTTALAAGTWYHIAARYNGSDLRQVFVNGALEGTSNTAIVNATLTLPTRLGDDSNGNYLDGQLDEVRMSSAIRAAGYIQTSFNNQSSPGTFYTVGPETSLGAAGVCGANGIPCASLGATATTNSVTVTAPGTFEMRFDDQAGGGVLEFYDLVDDPGKTVDLAGGGSRQDALFLDEVNYTGFSYRSDKTRGRADLLESTPARVKVRSFGPFQRFGSLTNVPGLLGMGDYSVLPSGRMALRWLRAAAATVTVDFQQLHLNVQYAAAGILSGWGGYTQSGPILLNGDTNPAADQFVMMLLDQPAARTDFQMAIAANWPAANTTYGDSNANQLWAENSWYDTTVGTSLPFGVIQRWDFLTWFKPTDVFNHLDARAVSRNADYRTPAVPAMAIGQGWFDTNEVTSAGDFFNEGESSYNFDLDTAVGLRFDMNGLATNRNRPFFKVRQWRSLSPPPTITVEGVTKTRNVDFLAEIKPVTRAYWATNLAWHCDLEDMNPANTCQAGVNLDVGTGGSVNATTALAGYFGNAVGFDANGDYVRAGTGSVLDFSPGGGSVEFWYQPQSIHTDGVRRILWMNSSGAGQDCFVFEKDAANALRFTIVVDGGNAACTLGGTTYTVAAAAGAYAWQPGDWIHLKTTWETGLLQIFMNGRRLAFFNGYSPVGVTHGLTYFGGCPGACPLAGGNGNAFGVMDEPAIYTGNGQPRQVAQGGLLGSALEALGDTANNWSFNFDPVGSGDIGRYLYIGSESKFRGLNVILQAAGVGVAAGDLDWEYWNGTSWANLEATPGFTDGTNSFTKAGTIFWTADPAGWNIYSVDGGPLLFFVRAHLKATSAGYSGYPQERLIKTDILLLNYCADVTLNNQTFDILAPVPTAVDMLSFTAEPRAEAVDLAWETASEIHNLGFHLYRAEDVAGPYERITTSLIPGLGSSPTGARYSYRDGSLENGTTYYYRLEDWDTSGATKPHGPVWATPGTDTGSVGGGAGPGDESGVGRLDYGDATGNSLRILERGPNHVVLELLTSGFTARSEAAGTVRLSVPGFDDPDDPGAPALPLRGVLVDAPVGRRARIASIEPSGLQTFDGFRLSGTGARVVEVAETGILRPGRVPRPTAGAATRGGFFPRHYARIVGSAFQGETKKLRLELAPLRHDVAGGLTVLARRLVVRVEFFGKEVGERGLGGSRGRRPALPPLRAKGVVAQLVLRGPGLHRVTFEDLFGAGRRGVQVSDLRLSHRDVDVAYHVEPPRALFGPGSALYFVAPPAENPHGETVYELATGRRGTVMPQVNAAPGGPAVTEASSTLAFEQNKYYQAALLEAPDLWLWDLLVSPVAKTYPFTVTRPAPSSKASSLRVVLQGASDFEAEADHHLRLSVNGSLVAETTWGGRTPTTVEANLPPGLLVEGSNVLEIENVGDTPAAYSMVFLNRFEVSYPQRLEAEGGRFEALFEAGGSAEVAGLQAGARLVETTSMSWLTGASPIAGALAFRAEAGRSYLAVDAAAVLTPEVRSATGSWLRATSNRADWILLGPRAFLAEAGPLVELRRGQGLLAKTVAVEDIYAQFGHGEPSPLAVRRFLEYAFQSWRRPSPRYVVLLGDSTYDPKDYLGTGVRDRVPTPVVQTSYLWTASDPALAAVNGEDLVPDLALGRLPAKDVAEARRLLEKLVAFESAGRDLSGTAVLVADNADLAGHFEADADDVAATALAARAVEKVYVRDLGAATRDTIRSAFDSGPGLVSYVGHGATAVWASENVWNNTDVSTLAAQEKQPLLLTLNCLNGFFHFPPLDSLAEAFVKAEGRGAIAAFSPSGLSVNDAAHVYHKALLTEIESGRHERLGDAVLAAQALYADQGAFPELLSIYHLFADPAMRIH